MQNFGALVYSHGISVADMADWCMISRQLVYKYIRGDVDPKKISFINIVHLSSYIGVSEDEVYNSICESYESIRYFDEKTQKWIKPDVFKE